MVVTKEKIDSLEVKMKKFSIREEDLIEKFILGSGKGGQKIQKTHSCVYLKHIPTGIEIKCQKTRSREDNRYFARKELVEKIEEITLKEKSEKKQAIEKIRRQKRKRSKRAKEKILQEKKKHAEKKSQRKPPQINNL
ncbi:MAG: peptide chain release factor-like protein [Chlamydiae bacterium CG10_big_fil_rev_8_21_14_0_10_35_9]|nr:MAG: peptide chain release factor-like protein [Chlamydiae bacterium CG10_big_fil_rev_8_21_14_0_10_35_9]